MKNIKNINNIDYQELFKNLPGLYIVLTPDLTIADVTDTLTNASMTKREDIIGQHLFKVFPDNPDNKKADGEFNLRNSLEFVLKNKITHTMAVQRYDIQKPDGTYEVRYWSPINKPLLNSNNEVEFIIHRVEDVTEFITLNEEKTKNEILSTELQLKVDEMGVEIIKRSREIQQINNLLEEKVLSRTKHLKEANDTIQKNLDVLTNQKKQLEDFSSTISHNLRAPLVNISMLSEMLQQSTNEDEKQLLATKLKTVSDNLN